MTVEVARAEVRRTADVVAGAKAIARTKVKQ